MNRMHAASLLAALAFTVLATRAAAQDAPASEATPDATAPIAAPPEGTAPITAPPDATPVAPPELVAPTEPVAPIEPAAPAEQHEAQPGSPVTARYIVGKGLTLRSEDGLYTLTLRGRIDLRGTIADRVGDDDAASTEFQARRARIMLGGTFIVPELTYYLHLGFANRDLESDLRVPLRDAWIEYAAARDLTLRIGEAKVPFNRQFTASSSALIFTERSLAHDELGLDRDVGVYAFSKNLFGLGDRLQYQLGMFGGDGRNRLSTDSGLLWVARIEVSPFGKFESYVESDQARTSTPHLQLAFGAALNKNTVLTRSTTGHTYTLGGFDYQHLEADLIFKWAGLSLLAEWLWRDASVRSHSGFEADGVTPLTEHARAAWGYVMQGAYCFPFGLELGVRYGEVRPRSGSDPGLNRSRELGGAVNFYFEKDALKVQTDYFYTFGDTFEGGQHRVRVQAIMQF